MRKVDSISKIPRGSYLYTEIARKLRGRITQNIYQSGSKLPSAKNLADEFCVSAITIRHALRELSQEGLISGHQGLGVFVNEVAPIHRVLAGNSKNSIGDEIKRAGYEARIFQFSHAEIPADAELAKELHIRRGTKVFRNEKLTFANEVPVAYHSTILAPTFEKKLCQYLGLEFIFPLLHRNKIFIGNLHCKFGAVAANEELAGHLELPVGFPLLTVHYTPFDLDGKPIFSGTTIARADRFVFEVDLPLNKQAK